MIVLVRACDLGSDMFTASLVADRMIFYITSMFTCVCLLCGCSSRSALKLSHSSCPLKDWFEKLLFIQYLKMYQVEIMSQISQLAHSFCDRRLES